MGIKRPDFREDTRRGPAVGEEVLKTPDEAPLRLAQTEQRQPDKRSLIDCESLHTIGFQKGFQPALLSRAIGAAPVLHTARQIDLRADDLHGLVEPLPEEGGSEDLVPGHHTAPGFHPKVLIQPPGNLEMNLFVKYAGARSSQHMIQDPLLHRGKGVDGLDVLHRGGLTTSVPRRLCGGGRTAWPGFSRRDPRALLRKVLKEGLHRPPSGRA